MLTWPTTYMARLDSRLFVVVDEAFEASSTMSSAAREATLEDVPLLVDLMGEFYAESNTPFDPEQAANAFSHLLREPTRGAVWVLQHGGEPAGYVVLCIGFSLEFGGLDGFVDDLFVRRDYRRQGLGRQALTILFDEGRRRGVRVIHLEVGRDNHAAKDLLPPIWLSRNRPPASQYPPPEAFQL
jgi:ribosomal protein S18 acetylase RimI-like enzyme